MKLPIMSYMLICTHTFTLLDWMIPVLTYIVLIQEPFWSFFLHSFIKQILLVLASWLYFLICIICNCCYYINIRIWVNQSVALVDRNCKYEINKNELSINWKFHIQKLSFCMLFLPWKTFLKAKSKTMCLQWAFKIEYRHNSFRGFVLGR